MIASGAHLGFVAAAYAVTGLVLAGLLAWLVLDGRRQRAQLADLEARGIRRRSADRDPAA